MQPGLPMKKGRAGTMTHHDKRDGTTTLFAALGVATGTTEQRCAPQYRQEHFLLFLEQTVGRVPKDLAIHVIVDHSAMHQHANVKAWCARHPRVHFHSTPTPQVGPISGTRKLPKLRGRGCP